MDPIIIGGAIAAASAAGTAIYKNWQDKKRYRQQLKDERANWNMQNAYNSPAAQMQRLKSAGLNPNLVYQQGGALSGAGEMSTPNYPEAPMLDYQNIASQALNFDSALAAIDNTKANTDKTKQETYNLTKTNEEMDRTLGALKGATLLNQEERDYYASLFGVDPNNVQDLSVRGANILSELKNKYHNNKLVEQVVEKTLYEKDKAFSEASLAKLAWLFGVMDIETEASKRGYNVSWHNQEWRSGYNYYGPYFIEKDPKKLNYVLETFLREYKEAYWQSSDAKHIIDSTSQVLGSLPKLKFSSTPEEYYRKHK